jgi:hypothetical protein
LSAAQGRTPQRAFWQQLADCDPRSAGEAHGLPGFSQRDRFLFAGIPRNGSIIGEQLLRFAFQADIEVLGD